MPVLPPRIRLLLGIAGSLLIVVGSLGVGWLGPGSILRDWLFFSLLRNSRFAASVCAIFVVVGALLLLLAWISLGLSLLATARSAKRDPDAAARRSSTALSQVVTSALAWGLPLILTLPMFSRDMFAYVGQGRLMAAGLNPYTTGMADIPGWYEIGVDPTWADSQTPYGPVFVWLEKVAMMATHAMPTEVTIFLFRLMAVAGLAMLAYYAWRIAKHRGLNEAGVLWIVAASPLVLMNFVIAGHNDSLMLGFIVGGVYYALKDRPILGTIFVTIAIGVKPIALVALPIIGLIWAGQAAGWGAVIRRWLAVTGISVGTLALMGWGIGVGFGWIGALSTPTAISSWYAPANILGISIGGLFNVVGLDGGLTQTIVKLALLGVGASFTTYLMVKRRQADPLWLLVGAFAGIVLLSPVIHPWYGLWMITFIAIAGVQRRWQIRTVVYATVFFMLIGLSEPLDLIPRIQIDTMIPVSVIGLAIIGATTILIAAEYASRRRFTASGLVLAAAPLSRVEPS